MGAVQSLLGGSGPTLPGERTDPGSQAEVAEDLRQVMGCGLQARVKVLGPGGQAGRGP